MNHSGGPYGDNAQDVFPEPERQRVKVYRLNADGEWDDKGQGIITMQHLEQAGCMGLIVCAEQAPHKPLLIHRLSQDISYTHQSGADNTIISWTDNEAQTDIALSFQEAAVCKQMWHQIQVEQAHSNGQLDNGLRRHLVDGMEPSGGVHNDMQDGRLGARPVDLPPPELKHLESIAKVLAEPASMQERDDLTTGLQRGNYIRKLLDIFRSCEDLEDADSLRQLFEVMKNIIMLNDTVLLEILFSEENVMDVVGALEYDPELTQQQKHREFLRDVVVFKEVVPIRSPALREKIHQTYRLGYVKDVILPRVLDDGTFATFSSLMMFNNVEVVLALSDDPDFFSELFKKFNASKPGSEAQADIVAFLQELTALGKHLQAVHRATMHQKLIQLGLFDALTEVMEHGSQQMQLRATDVLMATVLHEPGSLREFLLQQRPKVVHGAEHANPLFSQLIQLLTSGAGGGLQEQVTEILRALLDPESMIQNSEQNEFLEKFYDAYIGQLMGVIVAGTEKPLKPGQGPSPAALGLIAEIMCFCVQHHGYRIKYYLLGKNAMESVVNLLRRREKWLKVAAVRFVRSCLAIKDDFYNRHIVQINLLEPIIAAFVANGPRYNLLNSVVLELVDFIRKQNLKLLIRHFMEKHYASVEGVDYDDTFVKLKDKWEQMQDAGGPESVAASAQLQAQRNRKDDRALDRDEEEYFGEGDDDEDGSAQGAGPGHSNGGISQPQMEYRLVDYADDEEDGRQPTSPGDKRTQQEHDTSPAEKRGRFNAPHEAHNFLVASPPLLKPGAEPLDWRRG